MNPRMLVRLLPKDSKERLKGWRKRIRLAYMRRWHAFAADDLQAALRKMGVITGDVIMVHSSFDRFTGFSGRPSDVIRVLQEAVGTKGTLLMPTLPFTGTAVDYVASGPVFDVRRTPSQMGMLTELFRRSPGVLRSVHPTHSVAAWGARSTDMLANHHLARTPCGEGSPFARLLEHDGRFLSLGAGIEAMTFFHYVEEALEQGMPTSPFTKEEFTLPSNDENGALLVSKTRLFDPVMSRRRNLLRLVPVLQEQGAWSETRLGELDIVILKTRDVMAACRRLAARGVYCYDA